MIVYSGHPRVWYEYDLGMRLCFLMLTRGHAVAKAGVVRWGRSRRRQTVSRGLYCSSDKRGATTALLPFIYTSALLFHTTLYITHESVDGGSSTLVT